MSNIYHTEPPTQGKVLIKTSYGDIDIELWAKEAPLACRNFIQLSLEGMYDNTIIHRIIKGFMVQMGDPTGTGNGGQSIWDKPFKDEVHGRIKFNHRGQVAMANENRAHTNKSQFFITLDNCEWLNGKHTIFGKVTGSTMFNVLRMGEVEVGENDLPIDTIKVLSVDVLWNPFEDIVPRDMSSRVIRSVDAEVVPVKVQKSERKAVRNANLLSFEDDEEADGETIGKFHSSHDSKFKSKKLSSKVAVQLDAPEEDELKEDPRLDKEENFDKQMKQQILKHRMKAEQEREKLRAEEGASNNNSSSSKTISKEHQEDLLDEIAMERLVAAGQDKDMKNKSEEFKKLKADLLRSRRAVNVLTGSEAEALRKETSFKEMISLLEQRRAKYMKRKNEFGNRSDETLNKLQKFQESLRSNKTSETIIKPTVPEVEQEHYHGQVLEDTTDKVEGGEELQGWHEGKLKFKKHIDDRYRLNLSTPDNRTEESFTVFDPRGQFGVK